MSDTNLKVLEDAGIPVDRIAGEERAVLESLSPEELGILANVHQKMEAISEDEVQGQTVVSIGGVVF